MKIETLCVGPLEVNCYILITQKEHAIIIDPGADGDEIIKFLKFHDLEAKFIINTHGHIDHTGNNAYVKEKTGADLLIHEDDAFMLEENQDSYFASLLKATPSPKPDILLKDKDIIELDDIKLEVIHTPGHTPGGICLKTDKILFTGDTLFVGGIGRTNFPYSDHNSMILSLKKKILSLPDETMIYPGHNYGITPTATVQKRKTGKSLYIALYTDKFASKTL